MDLTSLTCRSARALLNWTVEDLALSSGVGISTIQSFENAQRTPMRANIEALERALGEAGVLFIRSDEHGKGVRLRKTAEAFQDMLLIAAVKATQDAKIERITARIKQFRAEAAEFYGADPDRRGRVDADTGKLADRISWEIERRLRMRRDDEPTQFLERIIDLFHGDRVAFKV